MGRGAMGTFIRLNSLFFRSFGDDEAGHPAGMARYPAACSAGHAKRYDSEVRRMTEASTRKRMPRRSFTMKLCLSWKRMRLCVLMPL